MSNWFSYTFQDDENRSVFVKGKEISQDHAHKKNLKHRLEITFRYNGNKVTRLPDETTLQQLDELEHQLKKYVEYSKKAEMVLVFTGNNRRVWYIYTSDVNHTIVNINKAITLELELSIIHDVDEDWDFYQNFAEKKEDK